MKLVKIKYDTFGFTEHNNDWNLEELTLSDLNLIVGKNATGKSRVTDIIRNLATMITKEIIWGNWDFTFITLQNEHIRYQLSISPKEVIKEEIVVNGNDTVLKRSNQSAEIFSVIGNTFQKIHPPANKLVLHVRRDVEEYPYLEDIVEWAEQTFRCEFGSINSRQQNTSQPNHFFKALGKDSIEKVIHDVNQLGYPVTELHLKEVKGVEELHVKEQNLQYPIPQNWISQGMFRSLSFLIFIQYLLDVKKATTILVDDLCESLDYERATKLGKLIFEKMAKESIQFIATSNDSFLMDVVDIRYWNILTREGSTVKSYNYHNSKEKFDQFKFTGLSNFDLFSSDYLLSKE